VSRGLKALAILIAFGAIFYLSRHELGSSTSTSTTATSTSISPPSTSTSILASTCVTSDLAASYNYGEGAAGTIYASITLTKNSSGSCELSGWPLLTLQDKYGSVLHEVIVRLPRSSTYITFPDSPANTAPKVVPLSRGQSARIDIAYNDVPTGRTACETVATISLQVAAGQSARSLTPAYPLTACGGGKIWLSPYFN
jgi:Protein of unknown function (DUF4232)